MVALRAATLEPYRGELLARFAFLTTTFVPVALERGWSECCWGAARCTKSCLRLTIRMGLTAAPVEVALGRDLSESCCCSASLIRLLDCAWSLQVFVASPEMT